MIEPLNDSEEIESACLMRGWDSVGKAGGLYPGACASVKSDHNRGARDESTHCATKYG